MLEYMTSYHHPNRPRPPDMPSGWWYACDHPERAHESLTVWVWDCDACVLALVAAAQRDPTHASDEYDEQQEHVRRTTIADTLAAVRAWRTDQGLRRL